MRGGCAHTFQSVYNDVFVESTAQSMIRAEHHGGEARWFASAVELRRPAFHVLQHNLQAKVHRAVLVGQGSDCLFILADTGCRKGLHGPHDDV